MADDLLNDDTFGEGEIHMLASDTVATHFADFAGGPSVHDLPDFFKLPAGGEVPPIPPGLDEELGGDLE
jgi:hypothetical protein